MKYKSVRGISKFQRKLGKYKHWVFISGIILILTPWLIYFILNANGSFDFNTFIGFYFSVFSVFLGLIVFLELQEKKISDNNEEFMDILIDIIDGANTTLTIVCPNINIGQAKLKTHFIKYCNSLRRQIQKGTKITFYTKEYSKGVFFSSTTTNTNINSTTTTPEDGQAFNDNSMFNYISTTSIDGTGLSDKEKNEFITELNHLLVDINSPSVELKTGDDAIWDSFIFAAFNENKLFFGVYSDNEIKGEIFNSNPAITAIKKLLHII